MNRRLLASVAVLGIGLGALTGCSGSDADPPAPPLGGAAAGEVVSRVAVTTAPSPAPVTPTPGTPTAAGKTLKTYRTVQVPAGSRILFKHKGDVRATIGSEQVVFKRRPGTVIRRSVILPPSATVLISVRDDAGRRVYKVRTGKAQQTDAASVEQNGGTYGVGQPVVMTFDQSVQNQDAVIAKLRVRTSKPVVGDWAWLSSTTLVYRPREFWPGKTTVTIHADLGDVQLSPGVWGEDTTAKLRIGRTMVMRIDDAQHMLKVYWGKQRREMPVSMGKPGYETRSGTKIILERYAIKRMVSTGPEPYDVSVPWALRLTITGEFLHGAPWNGNIGYANTSHGCVNLHIEDAKWLYDNALPGDPVVTVGTGARMETWNGIGGVWSYTWKQWQALN